MSDSDGSDPGYPRATSRVSMGMRNLRGDERQTLAGYDDGELSDNDEEILQDEAYRGRRPEVRRRNFSSAHHGAFSFDGPLGGSLRGLPVSSEPPASSSGDIAIEEPLLDSQLEAPLRAQLDDSSATAVLQADISLSCSRRRSIQPLLSHTTHQISTANAVLQAEIKQLEATVEQVTSAAGRVFEPGAVDNVGAMGTTALVMVCTNGKLPEVKALVEVGGARINLEALEFCTRVQDTDVGKAASKWKHGTTPLMAAACGGHTAVVRYLFENGADLKEARKGTVESSLLVVIQKGFLEIALLLLDNGADANAATKDGWSPLAVAVDRGHLEIARLLLERGVDINKALATGTTVLILAVQHGHLEIVQLLLVKGADKDTATKDGWSPLAVAVDRGHLEIVQLLLGNGADANKVLISAVQQGHLAILQLLLEKGADANAATKDGWSPLAIAVDRGHLELVQLLLENGADAKKALAEGTTVLILAVQQGHLEIALLLLGNGADANKATKDGWGPLAVAVDRGHLEIVRLLLEKDADANKVLAKGTTVLILAVQHGHLEIASLLLQQGAVADKGGATGKTPLLVAIQLDQSEMAQLLLDNGADVNKAMVDGTAPLLAAVVHKRFGLVLKLLTRGADPDQATTAGNTALYHAVKQGNQVCIVALLSHVKRPNQAVAGNTALYHALSRGATHTSAVLMMLELGTVHLVPTGGVARPGVAQMIRSAPGSVLKAFARSKSAVFGANLRGQQLWLWCNLMVAVGPNPDANTLRLNVQRGNMQGLCSQIGIAEATGDVTARPQPLDVHFVGENGAGDGLRREWLNQTTVELLDLQRGLFSSKDGGRTIQPNPESKEVAGADHLSYFALLGRIAGFVLYHREPIVANWTTAFIKAVFGYQITSDDLAAVDPILYKNKCQLIENYQAAEHDGKPLAEYWEDDLMMDLADLTFAADQASEMQKFHGDGGGAAKRARFAKVELKPGGAKIEVTEANKAEYIQLFVRHHIVGAIKDQVRAFQKGLGVFFSAPLLARLRRECTPTDVKLLLCGAPEIDVDDWQASAVYRGRLDRGSAQVKWFWSVLRSMGGNERAKVLDFCTGSPQAPATGFANLMGYSGVQQKFCLELLDGGPDRFPTAATCFNTLKMPAYASEEQLQDKLLAAINNAQGFDEHAVAIP